MPQINELSWLMMSKTMIFLIITIFLSLNYKIFNLKSYISIKKFSYFSLLK